MFLLTVLLVFPFELVQCSRLKRWHHSVDCHWKI